MSIEVYCDESRPELFVGAPAHGAKSLIGSLWLPSSSRAELKSEIASLRQRHGVWGEFKWNRVSASALPFYEQVVNLFFERSDISFRCIVIDADRIDLARFHQDDAELGFYKFYYQLLYHWIKPNETYSVFCDDKVNRDPKRLQTLRTVLATARPHSGVKAIQSVQSSQSVLVQMCDVILGATQARFNGTPLTSEAKLAVIDAIERKIGHRVGATVPAEQKFNVFKIELR